MISFVPIPKDSDFPLENLPYGVFSTKNNLKKRIGIAIGNHVLDLSEVANLYPAHIQDVLRAEVLNPLMERENDDWALVRKQTTEILTKGSELEKNDNLKKTALILQSECDMHLGVTIGDYTDFYSSVQHAINCGIMFRGPENPLLPNWKHLPVAYHGRSSSIVISGMNVHRPYGQIMPEGNKEPIMAPCRLLDFEMEMAVYIGGKSNSLGQRIPVNDASKRIFGFSLMNDWSARDIQKWESVPLGPFTAKNFCTTVSPWIVSLAAMEHLIVPNQIQDVPVLPYLKQDRHFNFDLGLEVSLKPENKQETVICRTNYKNMYWSPLQQIAHHTITGCNLRPGDILGSGTISGETPNAFGSILELSWKGTKPIRLVDGESRTFIENGDEVIMRGHGIKNGIRIGFGECRGKVLTEIPFK